MVCILLKIEVKKSVTAWKKLSEDLWRVMVGYKNFKAKKYINLVVAKIQEPKFNHFKFFQISPSETAVIV